MNKIIALLSVGLFTTSAHATTVAVSEPSMVSLIGLGAVATVLAIRFFRD